MSDVLARLMRWMETSDIDDADIVLRDAITEIAGLRASLDELRRASSTLTDEEREAVESVTALCDFLATAKKNELARQDAATLRGLLERLGGER
jgi:FtsZ-binding cell division protein ZapB